MGRVGDEAEVSRGETEMRRAAVGSIARLMEDVEKAKSTGACGYFGHDVCSVDCPVHVSKRSCVSFTFADIARRLHALMPHDRRGAEIRPGDTIESPDGIRTAVTDIFMLPATVAEEGASITAVSMPDLFRVVPPDSWEKLKDDLGLGCCTYFDDGNVTEGCNGCRADELGGNMDGGDCDELMFDDIVRRAKELAMAEQMGAERA